MAQVKQTCSITNGSQVVTLAGIDLTARLKKNSIFMVATELVPYTLANDSTYAASATIVTLTGAYQGATNGAAAGVFVADMTFPSLIPTISQGDVGTAAVFTAAMNKIQTLLLTVGNTAPGATILASEALTAGDFVNVFNNFGAFNVRRATAGVSTKQATGYVLANVAVNGAAIVYFQGVNNMVTGQVSGDVYLQAALGQAGVTPPSASGNIVQNIGVATSSTSIIFQAGLLVGLA